MQRLLGIPVEATELEIHTQISRGFSANRLMQLTEEIERAQLLTVEKSDRFFRVAHTTATADIVFGSWEKAKRWLSKPKERFAGQTLIKV